MTAPTFFSITADFKSVIGDTSTDVDYDPQLSTVSATVTFRPVLQAGDIILAADADPRPTMFVPAPIRSRIDVEDGRLKMRVAPDGDRDDFANEAAFPATGMASKVYYSIATQKFYKWIGGAYVETYSFAPVRLLADTPLLQLASPLYYTVTFTEVVYNGAPGIINPFTFRAPNADVDINLATVARAAGSPLTGISRGFGFADTGHYVDAGGILIMLRQDGIELPIEFPSPVTAAYAMTFGR